ncbi:hypothetical protein FRC14_000325 [Serendipita sp. 396]|nr:hypothetical protein FRC14_000325 [Serendipita sp. 396]KAG8813321.1 hypothetical protein FRC19_002480 [Serendipita sp. 401]KAG9044760.1 hypothetical protein FS842_001389 [Serendipita sp. 407]
MKQSIENWNHELNRENTIGWVPYKEEENAPSVVAGDPTTETKEGRVKSGEDDDWEWEDLVNWGPTPPLNSDTSKPNYRYEPIGTLKGVPENDPEQEQDDWDPSQPHPLQFPDHLRTSGLGEALKAYGTQTREAQEKPTRKGDRSWDTWRYEPRPFRNSVGADERLTSPHPTHYRGVESMGSAVAHRIERKLPTYSSPPRGPSAFTSYPVKRGSHSTKSAGWDKDKRGRKMRQRDWEEMQPSGFGQADDMLLGQDENEFSLSGVLDAQEAPAGAQEKEMQEEKRVADRLRAILDGTN